MKKCLIAILLGLILPCLLSVKSQARPRLTDQQVGALVGLKLYPEWIQQQTDQQTLVYGVVKPEDRVPAQVADDSYLIADGEADSPVLYYQTTANNREVVVESAPHRHGHLKSSKLKIKQLVQQFYRTKDQQRRVNTIVSALRTE